MNAEQIRNSWDDDHDVTQPCAFPEPLAEVLTRENRELRGQIERVRALADWYDLQPNWRAWGIGQQFRAALDAES